ncbi:protein kinase family protein [Candidatus Micrarchaeota archaeon]|nr:protein kinase family protein [Candidatus Micrarchaeota archaeon]
MEYKKPEGKGQQTGSTGSEISIVRKFAALKDAKRLPGLPKEVTNKLLEDMHRGDEKSRTMVHYESERTVPETASGKRDVDTAEGGKIAKGSVIELKREVRENGGTKIITERFEIEEKLSGKDNIAGDVWRAKRYWDGVFYGDVVLKTPKEELKRGSTFALLSVYKDIEEEKKTLFRFMEHPNILSPSGEPFKYNSEPVIQMEYHPWGFNDYLRFFSEESDLTAALMTCAVQCLSGIDYMANKRSSEAPAGWVHADFKSAHVRLDYKEDESGEKGWIAKIIDLDSVMPAGPKELLGSKYNREYIDPDRFSVSEDGGIGINVEPVETVYSLGLLLLYATAKRFGVGREERKLSLIGENERVVDAAELKKRIGEARFIDEINFVKLYYANKFRRIMAGKFDHDPEPVRDLLARYSKLRQIRQNALEEMDNAKVGESIHPYVLAGIRECLRPQGERLSAGAMQEYFEKCWEAYLAEA